MRTYILIALVTMFFALTALGRNRETLPAPPHLERKPHAVQMMPTASQTTDQIAFGTT